MVGALVCLVSAENKGLGYDGRDRRSVIFTHFKDSGLLNVSAFSLHELLFLLELEAGKMHAGPKTQRPVPVVIPLSAIHLFFCSY